MKSMAVAQAAEAHGAAAATVNVGEDVKQQPAAQRRIRDLSDFYARAIIVGLFSFMAVRIGANYLETGRPIGLLLLASEALVVVLTVFRRAPMIVDRSIRARVLTTLAMIGPPLVAPAARSSFVSDAITVSVCTVGLLVVIGGKLSLGRSFGLIPANRGIVSSGLYRLIRHPIYLGYFITHVAFLAANPSVWNFAFLIVSDLAQAARAVCEEQTLAQDPAYREYQGRVRWRVMPGVF